MPDDHPVKVCVVCEAHADWEITRDLSDRVLIKRIDWIEREYITWTSVSSLVQSQFPCGFSDQIHGSFSGLPGQPDASTARKALVAIQGFNFHCDVVFLIRDADGQFERIAGLEQARSAVNWPFAVVIGFAIHKRECWVLSGFAACDSDEEKAIKNQRKDIGFDPTTHSHQLTATLETARRSAKRVLRALTSDDRDRERQCWLDTGLDVLQRNGAENGLAAFLDECEQRYIPLFTPVPPPPRDL